MDIFENLMSSAFASGKGQSGKAYTEKEIEAAHKRQKKEGGTLLENLEIVTGRSLKRDYDIDAEIEALNRSLLEDFGNLNAAGVRDVAEKTALMDMG